MLPFTLLEEAIAFTRANFRGSPAEMFLCEQGIVPKTAAMYGVGYGLPYPPVSQQILKIAQTYGLSSRGGWWRWAGGVVYADPPLEPRIVYVRHLREGMRSSEQIWGTVERPAGTWRIGSKTQLLVLVRSLVDMLAVAQVLYQRGIGNAVVPLFLVNSDNTEATSWLRKASQGLFILPSTTGSEDVSWVSMFKIHDVRGTMFWPPEGKSLKEALLTGWWPFGSLG